MGNGPSVGDRMKLWVQPIERYGEHTESDREGFGM